MTTIIQLNKDDLRSEIKKVFRESIEEIKNLPAPQLKSDRCMLNEACELTGLSKSQIYKLTGRGEIPFKKFAKRLIFSRRELNAWIESQTNNE